MSAWYYQDMSTAQAVVIVTNIRQDALEHDAFGSAQLAIRSLHGINPSQLASTHPPASSRQQSNEALVNVTAIMRPLAAA